jgi:hypothetical protein
MQVCLFSKCVLFCFFFVSGPAHVLWFTVASGWNKERCIPAVEIMVTLIAAIPICGRNVWSVRLAFVRLCSDWLVEVEAHFVTMHKRLFSFVVFVVSRCLLMQLFSTWFKDHNYIRYSCPLHRHANLTLVTEHVLVCYCSLHIHLYRCR